MTKYKVFNSFRVKINSNSIEMDSKTLSANAQNDKIPTLLAGMRARLLARLGGGLGGREFRGGSLGRLKF